ncbi:hypothetical protein GF1_00590 [Desulfolithobacter dissulfuricans]|uniref:Fibronectin type-III domain-containing protein n=1 Tax=Desulfolithobacter dissulfuricans TaxID=2795293 RepID=A0A915TXQ8_9BACT|nr:hypothetical protein [Desulfolithobacter dissulfuricans]BCO07683.1 hypothetical protein GF1_00590 [Desulfolithobacter dissulfuricans]
MSKKGIWGAIVLTLLMPAISLASSQTLTISWNIADSSGISGYKMYYAYDDQMTNKTVACENYENPATTSSLTCSFDVDQYPFFVQIAAVPSDGSPEILSAPQQIIEFISTVQDFQVVPSTTESTASYAINFQPETSEIPSDYLPDTGNDFNTTDGYGWINNDIEAIRDRNSTLSPDQAYDTFIAVNPTAIWEISVPNGSYDVEVSVGDPAWPTPEELNSVHAEGVTIINQEGVDSSNPWITRTQTIQVKDSRLTLTFTGSDPYTKLCWIKITPAP